MGRKQTVNYTALDVKIYKDDVSLETYLELFKILKDNHREIPLSRDNYLHLTSIKPINDDNPINGFKGEIFKRSALPSDWYDTIEEVRSTKKNIENEFLPENLKAKVRFFNFVFYPIHQKIVCEVDHAINKISENIIEEFFKFLLGTEELRKIFKRIEVNLVPEHVNADKIIQTPQLTQLELIINYDFNGIKNNTSILEKEILTEMEESNIRTYSRILTVEKGKFLSINQRSKELIRLAVKNGYVKYKFKNSEDRIEEKSSEDKSPFIKRVTYDSKKENLYDLLLRETSIIANDLGKKN